MEWIMVAYIALICLAAVWATSHANDTDENGCFKVQWRMMLVFFMFVLVPVVAKLVGLA